MDTTKPSLDLEAAAGFTSADALETWLKFNFDINKDPNELRSLAQDMFLNAKKGFALTDAERQHRHEHYMSHVHSFPVRDDKPVLTLEQIQAMNTNGLRAWVREHYTMNDGELLDFIHKLWLPVHDAECPEHVKVEIVRMAMAHLAERHTGDNPHGDEDDLMPGVKSFVVNNLNELPSEIRDMLREAIGVIPDADEEEHPVNPAADALLDRTETLLADAKSAIAKQVGIQFASQLVAEILGALIGGWIGNKIKRHYVK